MTESMQENLVALGEALAAASLGPLQAAAGDGLAMLEVTALMDYNSLAQHVAPGTVVVETSSIDGAGGRTLLTADPDVARLLLADASAPVEDGAGAGAEAGAEDDDTPGPGPLSASALIDLAAVVDRVNDACADALSLLLGQRVRYEDARASTVEDPRFVVRPGPVQAICITFGEGETRLRLIQFAPNALLMRAAQAFENLAQDAFSHAMGGAGSGPSAGALGTMQLRVWAELGRTEIALGDALGLPLGAVVELEQDAGEPVELMVNGMRYATGRLTVTDDGEWAMILDEIRPEGVAQVAAA